jgi:hypothetical protein
MAQNILEKRSVMADVIEREGTDVRTTAAIFPDA